FCTPRPAASSGSPGESSPPRQVASPRPLLGRLVQLREQLVIGNELFGTIEDLLVANRSRLIDDRVRALGVAVEPALRIGVEEAIGLERGARKIAHQREGEAHLLAPCLQRRHEVGAAQPASKRRTDARIITCSAYSSPGQGPEGCCVLLISTETLLEKRLATARSSAASPLKSPTIHVAMIAFT